MAKQLKKFCRITKYIEKTGPKLYEILDDLCIIGAFRPRHGHTGTTFIWPSKETIAQLDKMRYTEDIDKGCDIILAHIVHDYLPTAASWNTKKSDIPNGSNRKLEVKGVTANKVTLADGTELELDDKFKTFRPEHQTQAVWRVTKGSLDPKKFTKMATSEHARGPAKMDEGKPKQRSWPAKVGGNVASFFGGGDKAAAPFGHVVNFYNLLEKNYKNCETCKGDKGDKSNKECNCLQKFNTLCLMLSPEFLTTLTALFNGPLITEFGNYCTVNKNNSNTFGLTKYLDIVVEAHIHIKTQMEISGGGSEQEKFNTSITNALNVCNADSQKILEHIIHMDVFTAQMYSGICLSRYIEFTTLHDLVGNQQDVPDLQKSDVSDLCDIIYALCSKGTFQLNPTSDKALSTLITGIFDNVNKFNNSEFSKYPRILSKETYKNSSELCKKIYNNTSLSDQIANLDADTLKQIFVSLTPKE